MNYRRICWVTSRGSKDISKKKIFDPVNPFIDKEVEQSEGSSSHNIMDEEGEEKPWNFDFPIHVTNQERGMKNINHANVPHFQGLTTKDPSTFLSNLRLST